MNLKLIYDLANQATTYQWMPGQGTQVNFDKEKFAELIVKHILEKIDTEIGLAYEQEQPWTAATLEALALEVLDDFDMELDEDDLGDPNDI